MMFENMIQGWFSEQDENYNDFIKALLSDDLEKRYWLEKISENGKKDDFIADEKYSAAWTKVGRYFSGLKCL